MSRTFTPVNITIMGSLRQVISKPAWMDYTDKRFPSPQPAIAVDKSYPRIGKTLTLSKGGPVTPGFKKLKPGQYPMNPFTLRREEIYFPFIYKRTISKGNASIGEPDKIVTDTGYYSNDGSLDFASNSSYFAMSALSKALQGDEARNKILLKVKDQKSNVAQFIAERQQCIDMVSSTVKAISESIIKFRKGDFIGAAAAVGVKFSNRSRRRLARAHKQGNTHSLANGWLQLQYGWLPLMSDVKGVAETLAAVQNDIIVSKASSAVQRSDSQTLTTKTSVGNGGTSVLTEIRETKRTVKYTIYYKQSCRVASVATSLGLTNPALIAWEVIPFSFVVDWFLPVGNFLSAFDATVGLTFERGCVTVHEELKTTITQDRSNITENFGDVTNSQAKVVRTAVTIDRSPISSWPTVGVPSFKNPLSLTHMANSLALLRQLVTSRH